MSVDPKRLTAAEIQFDKLRPTPHAKKPVVGYEADAISVGKKTERLKALRLARDAEAAAAQAAAPAKRKRTKKAEGRLRHDEGNSPTVAGWWKDQKGEADGG